MCTGSATAFFWVNTVKPRLGVDDALDVAALQGVPGILGTFCVGIFAQYNVDLNDPNKIGLVVGGNGRLLLIQTFVNFLFFLGQSIYYYYFDAFSLYRRQYILIFFCNLSSLL